MHSRYGCFPQLRIHPPNHPKSNQCVHGQPPPVLLSRNLCRCSVLIACTWQKHGNLLVQTTFKEQGCGVPSYTPTVNNPLIELFPLHETLYAQRAQVSDLVFFTLETSRQFKVGQRKEGLGLQMQCPSLVLVLARLRVYNCLTLSHCSYFERRWRSSSSRSYTGTSDFLSHGSGAVENRVGILSLEML